MKVPTSEILNLISKGYLSYQIADELKISRVAVHKRLWVLEKDGYIQTKKKGIILELSLTAKGLAGITTVGTIGTGQPSPHKSRGATRTPPQKVNSPSIPETPNTRRLHALGLKYELLNPLNPSEPILILHEQKDISPISIGLNHNSQAMIKGDISARLTTHHLILYPPAIYYSRGEPTIKAELQAKILADDYALELEQRLNIRLRRVKPNVLYSEIITEESADERHPFAEDVASEHKVVLARTPEGKERLVADRSKRSFPELEAVSHRTTADDSDIIDKQFNAIMDEKINLLDMDYYIKELGQAQADASKIQLDLSKDLAYYSHEIAAHSQAIAELNDILPKISDILDKILKKGI